MKRLMLGAWFAGVGALALAACGEGGSPAQPPVPTKLAFVVQPSDARAGALISPTVQVVIQDVSGVTVTTATNALTLSLGVTPNGARLLGTTTVQAVSGVASFGNLYIDRPGSGYRLFATAGTLAGATSAPFDVALFPTVTAGGSHTCELTASGAAYCWGWNELGQVGDGTTVGVQPSPTPVAGGLVFADVSAGGTHTCGTTTARQAYCWGDNEFGQVGDGTVLTIRRSPVSLGDGMSVSAGKGDHSCSVTSSGAAQCWGNNYFGQIGDGTQATYRPSPVLVQGNLTFKVVSAGGAHTCGVTVSSAAYCWGWNNEGELGDGTTSYRLSPVPVSGGLTFSAVSAGSQHTCGVTTSGAAYCWGLNTSGQLGDTTTTSRASPVLVAGGLTFASVSAGSSHTCGVTTSGAAYCWGDNTAGQLGDGTTAGRTSPGLVGGGLTFAAASAGERHSCGVTTGGAAYCWGNNDTGQLGDGSTTASLLPVPVTH